MLRDFFRSFITVHILPHAAQEPIDGLAMIEELRRPADVLGPGTLYPLLAIVKLPALLARIHGASPQELDASSPAEGLAVGAGVRVVAPAVITTAELSGCRSTSRTWRLNSGSSSRNKIP